MKLETGNWILDTNMRIADSENGADQRRDDSRRGVALIVVLGFLSIMVIMAVTFVMHARTERLVAASTLDAQRGRQIVRTALNAAMNDFSIELFPNAGTRYMVPPTAPVDMTVFTSVRPGILPDMGRLGDDDVRLLDGEVRDWIPRRYLTQSVFNAVADAEWIMVRENPSAQSRILGRYAYAVFDMSGGIDANFIALNLRPNLGLDPATGNPTNRFSVRDVGMSALAETADAQEFVDIRAGWHGFDTLSEIIKLTDGHYIDGQSNFDSRTDPPPPIGRLPANPRWQEVRREKRRALHPDLVTDLVPYSLAAYRGEWDWALGWVRTNIRSCEMMANWSLMDWQLALAPVAGQLENMDHTVSALRDYVSDNPNPLGVDYPSSKNIPMFNEWGLQFNLEIEDTAIPPTMTLNVTMEFEVWYPFPQAPPPGTFEIVLPSIGGGNPATGTEDIWIRCRMHGTDGIETVELHGGDSPSPARLPVVVSFNGGLPLKVAGSATYSIDVRPDDPDYTITATDRLQIASVTKNAPIVLERNSQPVDAMRARTVLSRFLGHDDEVELFFEVDDPRLNHLVDRWSEADNDSWNRINPAATAAGYEAPGGEGLYMFSRNAPMRSPGEFGFISTGRPWETIDLCTPEGAALLARIVTTESIRTAVNSAENNYTYYTNATINPNTSSTNVLEAAFRGLSTTEVPFVPGNELEITTLSPGNALTLAGSIIAEASSKAIQQVGGAYMNASDWVRVPAMRSRADNGLLALSGLNKNQREALIRNTWGLFSPANSMFTVVVIAQAIREGPHTGTNPVGVWRPGEDMITGERRAVALVWRDPTPGPSGHHEMYVRMFRMMDE